MSFSKRSSKLVQQLREFRVSDEVTFSVVDDFLQALDCPRSLTVSILLRNDEHEQLAKLEFNPLHYESIEALSDAYAATKVLSKYKNLNLSYDLDTVALEKFEKFESQCKRTNIRLKSLQCLPEFTGNTVWLHNAIIRKIERVLADISLEELASSANWGPGATTLVRARDASSTVKFQKETGITRDLYALFPDEILEGLYPSWFRQLKDNGYPLFQVGNKVVTVPKDSTTNRVIAIEPGINLWFQKAIGSVIRRRLRKYGIDLRYQSTNQEFAYVGSLNQRTATIDFSSASDSISIETVRALIPPRWFSIMDSARSHFGQRESGPVKWEKFSSMGNGFTFELESLIFYAIATCCVEYLHLRTEDVSVYGDDVIIPTESLDLFSKMSEFYGFSINLKKSHFSSCFRESCGAHYYLGADVKPIYLKDRLSDVRSVFKLANSIRRLSHRRMKNFACDKRLRNLFYRLVKLVPKSLRLWVPEGLGDGGFISNWDEATPVRARHSIEGYYVSHAVDIARCYESEVVGLLLARLWDASAQEERNTVPLRGRTRLRITRSLVAQWYDLGPWL